MTAALDNLTTSAERPLARRFRLADPSMILWLAMIAILVFLVASPMVRLVVSSFQEPETGRLTLSNYVEAYGRARHVQALWNTLQFGAGVAAKRLGERWMIVTMGESTLKRADVPPSPPRQDEPEVAPARQASSEPPLAPEESH